MIKIKNEEIVKDLVGNLEEFGLVQNVQLDHLSSFTF